MKKVVMALAAVVLVLGVVFVGYGMTLPEDYEASRTTEIKAPADYLYRFVIEQKNHEIFSPWKANDPSLKMTYNDIPAGVGASYSWTSEDSGSGTSTISSVELNKSMKTRLQFDGMSESNGFWEFDGKGESTRVTWGFAGQSDGLMDRYMGTMMDNFVGPSFEEGLALLKAHVEESYPKYREQRAAEVTEAMDVKNDAKAEKEKSP